ncbi:hypothetical protein JNM05_08805 [bacterium]|nr:hypothetical protein [bacterium]
MKKFNFLLLLFLMYPGLITTQNSAWTEYKKLISGLYKLTPYPLPNDKDGPCTLLRIERDIWWRFWNRGIERFVDNLNNSFNLPFDTVNVPRLDVYSSELSKLSFNLSGNSEAIQLLPKDISYVVSLSLSKNIEMKWQVDDARMIRVSENKLKEKILSLDPSNLSDEVILKSLMSTKTLIVTGTLYITSFKYIFNTQSEIENSLDIEMQNKAVQLNVSYTKISNKQFVMSSEIPMNVAYYAWSKNENEIKKMYDNKKRISELNKNILEKQNTKHEKQNEINRNNVTDADIQRAKMAVENKTRILRNKSASENDLSALSDLVRTLNSLEVKSNKISELQVDISNIDKKITDNRKEIEELEKIKYEPLGSTLVLPSFIDEIKNKVGTGDN